MSKVLATAAMVVGAVALVATGVGALAFGVTLATAAATVSVAGLSIGTLIAVSSALSVAASLTAKRPKIGGGGSQTSFKADPNASLPYAIGRTLVGGNIVYRRAGGGSDNPYQTLVTVLSAGGPIQSLDAFYLDKQPTTFSGGAINGSINGRLIGLAWQSSQLGASPEASALVTPAPTTPPGWTSAHKLSGLAASILTYKFDAKSKKVNLTSTPEPGWLGKWVKVYDPRLDSTYPGGSGSCRPTNESTYVWSENPYLHALTWLLGRFQAGKRILGVGLPLWAIAVPSYVEGANIADANGWKAGGVVYSADNKWQVLKAMLQAGGGEPLHLGAQISCLVNTPRVSLGTITADDLRGDVSVTATQARRERFNAVIPRYRSEDHQWEFVPAAPIIVASHVTEDGGQRTKEIEYPLVQDLGQAGQLARYDIENAREFGPVTTPLRTRFIGYKPGDCLDVTLPEVGLNGQKVLLLQRSIDPASGTVTLTSRSETDAKHAFALGQTATAPATPGVTGPPLAPVPQPGSWTISATSLVSTGGIEQPVLQIAGAIDSTIADSIVFEYRTYFVGQAAGVGWIAGGIEEPGTTSKIIGPIKPATAYEVAISYRARGVVGDRLILGPVTSGSFDVPAANAWTPALVGWTRNGTTFEHSGGNGWTDSIFSAERFAQARVSAKITGSTGDNKLVQIGLHDPGVYHWQIYAYVTPSGNGTYLLNSGENYSGTGVPVVTGDIVEVAHIGSEIRAFVNGADVGLIAGSITPTRALALYARAAATGATIDALTFAKSGTPGAAGPAGSANAVVYAYQRSGSGPPALPSATTTFDFGTKILSGLNNGWSQTIPAGTSPLYVTAATASSTTSSDTIASGEWAAAQLLAQSGANGANGSNGSNGVDGLNSATVFLFQRNGTGTPPAAPSVTTTYTFASGVLSGVNNGWQQTAPDPSGGKYLFMTTATALALATSDTIASGEWAAVKQVVKDGDTGAAGDPGYTVSPGSTSFSINVFSNGTPKTAQFDKTVTFKVLQGAVDLSDDGATTYVLLSATNCTAALGGTNGKVLAISAISADSAKVIVSVRRSGVEIARPEVALQKAYDGTKFNSGTSPVTSMPNSSSFLQIASSITLTVPNGAALAIAGHSQWFATGLNSYAGEIRASYQNVTDGGAETFGTTAAGDIAATSSEQATADCTAAITNSTGAAKSFTVRLYGRRASGAGAGATVSGSLEANVA